MKLILIAVLATFMLDSCNSQSGHKKPHIATVSTGERMVPAYILREEGGQLKLYKGSRNACGNPMYNKGDSIPINNVTILVMDSSTTMDLLH